MNKKFKSLFKDTFIFALGSLGSKIILFFLVPLYTNYLTTDEYGIADLVFTTAQLLLPVISVVIFEAVIRFGLMKNERPEEVLKIGMIMVAAGSIFALIITPILGIYKPISEWKWYLYLYLIFNFASNVEKSYLKVKDKNKAYAFISIFQTFILAVLNVIFLVFIRLGIKGYLISNIISMVASVIMSAFAGHIVREVIKARFNRLLFKKMVLYSAPLVLNDISWWIIHSSDKFMIESMVSAGALGVFTVATKIPSLINVFISIFGQAWNISSIKEMDSSNDTRFYSQVFAGYSFISFLACILIVSIIKPFMSIYVGADFRDAWKYVPFLLVSAVFSSISSYFGQLYAALKKSMNNMLTTLIAAITNIIINYVGIIFFDVWGAILGTVVSYIILANVRMIDIKRFVKININIPRYIINCILVLIHAFFVSLNINVFIVSVLCCLIFAIINYDFLLKSIEIITKRLSRK